MRSYKAAQGKKENNQCDKRCGGNIRESTEKEVEVALACGARRSALYGKESDVKGCEQRMRKRDCMRDRGGTE